MLAIDRWRNWRPSEEKFGESPECEPSKPSEPSFEGFEGSDSEQIQNFSCSAADGWRQDFTRWMRLRCAHRRGREDSGGIGALLVDFVEWRAGHGAVPCTRGTFERLLQDAGFRLTDGLACGLLLRVDVEAVLRSRIMSQGSEMPTRCIRDGLPIRERP